MRRVLALLLCLPAAAIAQGLFADKEVAKHIDQLGDGVVLREIDAPVIQDPTNWVGRQEGIYRYRYVAGDDHGKVEQLERHTPDPARPKLAWTRHVGESLIEGIDVVDGQGIRLHTETDLEHGYRVEIKPGITLPPGTQVGDSWRSDNTLTVYQLPDTGEVAHRGSLDASRRYLGAYRVRVPAGEFDAVLIEETYNLKVGPLSADDRRYVFYARDVGMVAEVEGLRASALIVFRMTQDSAKVLTAYPSPAAP